MNLRGIVRKVLGMEAERASKKRNSRGILVYDGAHTLRRFMMILVNRKTLEPSRLTGPLCPDGIQGHSYTHVALGRDMSVYERPTRVLTVVMLLSVMSALSFARPRRTLSRSRPGQPRGSQPAHNSRHVSGVDMTQFFLTLWRCCASTQPHKQAFIRILYTRSLRSDHFDYAH